MERDEGSPPGTPTRWNSTGSKKGRIWVFEDPSEMMTLRKWRERRPGEEEEGR